MCSQEVQLQSTDGGADLQGNHSDGAPRSLAWIEEVEMQIEQMLLVAKAKGIRSEAIFPPLCLGQFLIALEAAIPTASLPRITSDLGAGGNWVWIVNAYLLTNTAFIPMYGESAAVFGRRWPTIFAASIFILGSGIAGGATSTAMLIAGRAVQGFGGAGISVFGNVIVSDITSVRERGKYMAIVFGTLGLGLALGPPIGGVLAETNWRWVFARFCSPGFKDIDWIGNFLIIGSLVSILIALTWADTRYPWTSWRILVPFLVGFAGLAAFHIYEASSFCEHPTIPPRLLKNRTAAIAFALTFFMGVLSTWRTYFVVLYFEGVLIKSAARAGVLLLPAILVYVPASVAGGIFLSKTGRYKPIHLVALFMVVLASGLYIDFNQQSSLAKIVIYQMIAGTGTGILVSTTLPAAQAALEDEDSVAASALWAYLRLFGTIWGISIPAAIFNSRFAVESYRISDATVRGTLGAGNAYSHVSGAYISSLSAVIRDEVVGVYLDALRVVWYVCLGFSVVALAVVFFEKEVVMRTTREPKVDNTEKEATGQNQ
ncbi:hypothetical protein F5883DRAFT_628128 [Diaporthe sp. PMI_573]|nr:hypothetical protein F5883DRAFT_628128 [Diaporthaceae sp. PMI_573]